MILRLLFIFSLLISFQSFGQNMDIKGHVYDSSGTVPLIDAVAVAIRVKDSLLLGYDRTDATGTFELPKFPIDTFTLIISHPSFDDKFYYIFGHTNNFEIEIPKITMPTKAQDFEDVVIYANKNPIFYNGDTLVYVADSFKVAEHAVVEDLLKKLPGLEIDKDGKLKSQGKEIDQVLVDGDEFFGSDPTIATKNLGASGVETVQVYEKTQENAENGEETLNILDLRLKEDAKKGYFGRVSAASDFNQFYEGEVLLNKFNKTQKISVFVLGANTPKSDFGFGDRNKFGLDNEGGQTYFSEDGDILYSNNSQTSGIPQTLKAGIYFSDKIGKRKKTEIGFNYSYYNVKNNSLSQSRSQYFVQDSVYYSDDSTRYISENESHNINIRFESQLDSLTSLEIRPTLRISQGIQNNLDYSTWRDAEDAFSRSNNVANTNDATQYTLSNDLRFVRLFMKKRRKLAINYDLSLSDNSSNGNLNSTNILSDSTNQVAASYDQNKINNQSSINNSVRVSYFEPIGKKFKIQTEYSFESGNSDQTKETIDYNPITGKYDLVNTTFSNSFDNLRTQHKGGLQLWYESKKYTINGGLRVRNINIDNTNKVTDNVINQNITNLLPTFRFRYNPSRSSRMSLSYNTNSRQPSITDLQPVPDNTNPNRVRTGNADLKPDYSHSMNLNLNSWNALSGRYIYAGSYASLTQNAFGDSITTTDIGQQLVKKINVKQAANFNLYIGMGIPLWSRKIMISPNFNTGSYQSISYLNGDKNIATNLSVGPSLSVTYRTDSLEIELNGSLSYNQPKNTLSNYNTAAYSSQDYFASITWRLKYGFKIQANTNYTINSQRADSYNLNYLILNGAISKTFLKTRNLELTFLANDILNQNIDASRSVYQNRVTDNFTTIISRYFLLKLTYRFNSNKTTEEDAKNRWH